MRPLILALVLLSALRASAIEPFTCSAVFNETREVRRSALKADDDQSVSQAIRSQTVHYWKWAAAHRAELGAFAGFEGFVVGDPHFGNFSVVPVRGEGGSRRAMRFVDIDFDDAGVGSFAFDFSRFVITVKAVTKEVKVKEMLEAYIDGLKGVEYREPKKIREYLDLSMSDYDELEAKYVTKKTDGNRFEMKPGKIEPYKGKYSREAIKALYSDVTVLDIASRPVDGGKSEPRVWVLTRQADGRRTIEEIKAFEPSALLKFGAQSSPLELVQKAHSIFWPGLDGRDYDLVQLQGDLVWVRGKKVTLVDIPYQVGSDKKADFVDDLAIFDANYLGRLHGSQASARPYLRAIQADRDGFREALKSVMHDYLDLF